MSRFTTRSLLVTAALSAFTAVLVHAARIVGVALLGAMEAATRARPPGSCRTLGQEMVEAATMAGAAWLG